MDDNDIASYTEDLKKSLSKELIGQKMKEATLFSESAKEGGATNTLEAIQNLMTYCKVGIRELSLKTKIKRHKLEKMLRGELELPSDTMSVIYDVFESKKPELFGNL